MSRVGAVVVHSIDGEIRVKFEDVVRPEAEPGTLRIRPSYVGICGSDLEQIRGHTDPSFHVSFPHILGHEWSGTVEQTGSQCSSFNVGDRVIGHGDLGGNVWFGVSTNGAMADAFVVPESMCFAVPDEVSMLQAALIEPLACSLQGLRSLGGADPGHRMVVIGCGALGLAMVGLTSAMGVRVVAVDRSIERLKMAKGLGASLGTIADDGAEAVIRDHFDGHGADIVVEASGAPSAQAFAIDVSGQDARVCFMGIGHQSAAGVALRQVQNRNLRLSSSTGAPPAIWGPAIRVISQTSLDLSPIVSDVVAFRDCELAVTAAKDSAKHAKVMLRPDDH